MISSTWTRLIAVIVTTSVVLTGVYLVLAGDRPERSPGELIRIAAPLIGAVMVAIGVARHGPRRRIGWASIGAALTVELLTHAVWFDLYRSNTGSTFPSFADVLIVIALVPLFVGVTIVAADSTRESDDIGWFEIAVVSIAVCLCVWLAVVEPFIVSDNLPVGEGVFAAAVLLAMGAIFAISLRTAAELSFRVASPNLLAAGLGLMLVAGGLRTVAVLGDGLRPGSLTAAMAIAPPLLIGAAALDPSMARRPRRPSAREYVDDEARSSFAQIIGLSVAALTPLTVLFALEVADVGSRLTRTIAAVCAIVVVVIALARLWRLVGTVRELTERRGQDRLAAIVEHSSDIVMLLDELGKLHYASPGLSRTLGHRQQDWLGRPFADLVAAEDSTTADHEVRALVAKGPGHTIEFETALVTVDGRRRNVEVVAVNLLGGEAVDGLVVTLRDVTEQRAFQRQLSHRAFHDELTGLANRALFLDRMDHAIRVARQETDPVVVLFVDLDDFKNVNDALGHDAGDELLRAVADRIRSVAGSGDTPARLGGDEFALLLEDRGGVERALDVAEGLLDALRSPVVAGGREMTVLASVGVAVATPDTTTSMLLRDADLAMYQAKRSGKGRIKIFDPAMRLMATRHLEYRSDLGEALDNQELRLVFQPIVDLRSGEVTGAEALVRWHHPVHGEIAPSEFLPVAERSGLMLPLGRWILDEGLRQATTWQGPGRRMVSVNVAPSQLADPDFVDQVTAALAIHELPPDLLTLEFAELDLATAIDANSTTLAELRDLGVAIAVDDFGAGACTLNHLQRFPVDVIKIDKEHVDELGDGPHHATLARTIVQVAQTLGVTALAEGIERTVQLAELRRLGCHLGQGYLLSPPLEAAELGERFGVPADVATASTVPISY
jgi:diguanylate cyclase (GGDEF)-like protein/PAS domain S-box-containing protein